jgi:hypothetical protein
MSAFEGLKARWGGLAKREKIIMSATCALALIAGVDLGVIEPLGRSVVTGRKDLDAKKLELLELTKQRKALAAEVEAIKPVVTTQQETEKTLEKASSSGSIWAAPQAQAWLDAAVEDFGSGLVSASIAAEGEADPNLRGFFRHGLEIEASVTWSQAERFLKAQGAAPALVPSQLSLIPQEDGRLALRASLKAVSHQQYWKTGSLPAREGAFSDAANKGGKR